MLALIDGYFCLLFANTASFVRKKLQLLKKLQTRKHTYPLKWAFQQQHKESKLMKEKIGNIFLQFTVSFDQACFISHNNSLIERFLKNLSNSYLLQVHAKVVPYSHITEVGKVR